MKKNPSRIALEELDKKETSDYLPGTPQHLLLEAFRTTKSHLSVLGRLLNMLDKTTPMSASESVNPFDIRDLTDLIVTFDQTLYEKLRTKKDKFYPKIIPSRREGPIFRPTEELAPVSLANSLDEFIEPITIEDYYALQPDFVNYSRAQQLGNSAFQFKDLDAFTVKVLAELELCLNKTQQDIMRFAKIFCDYSRTLFIYLIPALENSYQCKIGNGDIRKALGKMKAWWDSSGYAPSEQKLFGPAGTFEYHVIVNSHRMGFMALVVEEMLTALYQAKQKIAALKTMHPANIPGDRTDIHGLLYDVGLMYDSLLARVGDIKTVVLELKTDTTTLEKTGFSYICDKVIEDYRVAHLNIETALAGRDSRRVSEDFSSTSRPVPVRTRTIRGYSIDEFELVSLPTGKGGEVGNAQHKVRSLHRNDRIADLFSPRSQERRRPALTIAPNAAAKESEKTLSSSPDLAGEIDIVRLAEAARTLEEMGLDEPSPTGSKISGNYNQ